MFKYVLFDLDGTLTDPKEGICKSVQYALHKMNIEENNLDKLEPFIGPPLTQSFMEFYGLDKEKADLAVEYYRERFSVVGLYENKPYPGIDKLLKRLKAEGCMLAVASSKPTVFVEKILKHFKLDTYFDVVIGSELDGRRTDKAEVVEEALLSLYFGTEREGKRLDDCEALKNETVMIGDRKFDIEGAKNHNIKGIGVGYGYAEKGEFKKAGAYYVAATVSELEDFLLGKKEEDKNKDDSLQGVSGNSFFKAVYVLTPFALFYLINMAVISMCVMVTTRMGYSNDEISSFKGYFSLLGYFASGLSMILFYRKTDKIKLGIGRFVLPVSVSGAALALGVNLTIGYILTLFKSGNELLEQAVPRSSIPLALGIVYYVFISPVAEELLFRYMIFGRLKKTMGSKAAIILSALFFGLYHGNIIQGIYAFLMGLALGMFYEWTQSLLAPILFHICANAIVYLAPHLPDAIRKLLEGPLAATMAVIIGIAAIYYIKFQEKGRIEKDV